ncbi:MULTISPECIES: sensor histidine kinase [Clostridium]|jgi:two-component system, NarL family, sensor histidine kinase DegS|uniref:sensor histidine kinase n=1 Tax=Clostridium TaxID=1485 RepID=UPI001AE35214|nr:MULTISPECIES: sensor histidine kinase [Clostridium]MBP1866872.1 two-component system sensor histidine kinase DegS [Clostridium tertium]MBS6503063.1 sensor histidine kinase [Clostridium sp.]MDU2683535.1 histidine kinase [Clostridium sp.]
MVNEKYSSEDIKEIIDGVIEEINVGKTKIFHIADAMRDELEIKKKELYDIKSRLSKVINEVDYLEKADKAMRYKLVEESKKLSQVDSDLFKEVYEEALDIRVRYITKQNEEKELILKRDNLERTLKNYNLNIEEAQGAVNQINIALGYLEGNILDIINDQDEKSQMIVGIKILENQELERQRIAREIHDGPAQYIANAMMRVDFCKVVVKKDLEKGINELDDLKSNIRMALKEVRGIIYDLRPLHLEELGLMDAIKDMINIISVENDVKIDMIVDESSYEVEKIMQIAIYRIMQEILNNIKKHSKAKYVDIKINYIKDYIYIYIQDDGIGFNVQETLINTKQKGNRYGLIGIFERVKQLRGKIEVKSSKGEGTIYKIRLPINRKVIRND